MPPPESNHVLPPVPPSWAAALGDGPDEALRRFLHQRQAQGRLLYPPPMARFAALARTPLPAVKAVIVGQDPYHGAGQAHGLSFSVPDGVGRPPSLRNIMRELAADVGAADPGHGCLEHWAAQGVLLLNRVLTVEDGQAGSHAGQGWEEFTHRIVRAVDDRPGHVAFVLWGAQAQKLAGDIGASRHMILQSAHPSPLSARRGFFGSKPFSRINAFLTSHGMTPIDWSLPPRRRA